MTTNEYIVLGTVIDPGCVPYYSNTIHNLIHQRNILTDFVYPLISMIHGPKWYLSDIKWYYETSSHAEPHQMMLRNTRADQVDLDNM